MARKKKPELDVQVGDRIKYRADPPIIFPITEYMTNVSPWVKVTAVRELHVFVDMVEILGKEGENYPVPKENILDVSGSRFWKN